MQNNPDAPLNLNVDDILVDRREDEDDATPHPSRVRLVKGELVEAIPIKRDFTKKRSKAP